MKKNIVLLAIISILSLCLIACGNTNLADGEDTQNNGVNSTENGQALGPCSLITKEEAELAIGMEVEDPEYKEQAALGQKICFYDGKEDSISASFVQLSILRTGEMPDNIIESGQTANTIYLSLKDNDLKPTSLEAIGDDAFWGTGGLYVIKGDVYFNISVGNSNLAENMEICKGLAEIVLGRL